MSSRVGTLQGSQTGRSIWPAAILAALVMLTMAVAAVSLGRDQAQPNPKTAVGGIEETSVGGTAANTPTELNGGIVGGIAGSHGRWSAEAGNTPSEMTGGFVGGIAPTFVSGSAQDEPIMVNGHICGQCG